MALLLDVLDIVFNQYNINHYQIDNNIIYHRRPAAVWLS